MKIAVCLSGHARSFRETASSWNELRSRHEVAFFACLWSMTDFSGPTWWSDTRPARPMDAADMEDFQRLFGTVKLVIREASPASAHDYGQLNVTSRCKPADVEQQWSMIQACHGLCLDDGGAFDVVVRSRPDVELNWFDPDLPREDEIVCTWRPHRAGCDAMFYGRPAAMTKAVSLAGQFPDCVRWLGETELIPENMFVEHCRRAGLSLRPSKQILAAQLVRSNGVRVPLTG